MSQEVIILSALIAVVVIIASIFLIRVINRPTLDKSISTTETMFRSVLDKAVGGRYTIHCKVPLGHVLEPIEGLSERAQRKALRQVKPYQFDYLVCEQGSNSVVCAVEFDDHSFNKKSFIKKDLMLESICQSVSLPLLRVAPQNGYNLVEIIERFERIIEPPAPAEAPVYASHEHLQVSQSYSPEYTA